LQKEAGVQQAGKANKARSIDAEGRAIVEQLGGVWRPDGGMCRCPAHDDETPSLSVRPGTRRLLFHCFAGCDVRSVMRALKAARLLGAGQVIGGRDDMPALTHIDRRNDDAAARLWAASRPITGSLAELYLQARGLALPVQDLRYHPRTPVGRGALARFLPAMLAAVRDGAGFVAIHRSFLDPRSGRLADLPVPKRALGRLGRGAVRLYPPREGVLGLAEGIESAMSATRLFGMACWATLGTERFARVALPAGISRLILFLDNDAGGRRAERLAREAHGGLGIEIEARYPAGGGEDWNDVLRGLSRDEAGEREGAG
jgi:hypothetical protein